MKISPSLASIQATYDKKDYDIVPIACEILSDFITPIEAMKKLKLISDHVYLLESATKEKTWGRYSFLGFNPKAEITLKDNLLKIGDEVIETDRPDAYLKALLKRYRSPKINDLPPFTGGLVGYFSFDCQGQFKNVVLGQFKNVVFGQSFL